MLEARLRCEIDDSDNKLVKFMLSFISPEVIRDPPTTGVAQFSGPLTTIPKDAEGLNGEYCFRLTREHTIISTQLTKSYYISQEEDVRLGALGLKNGLIFELDQPTTTIDVYINSDFNIAERIITDIIYNNIIDYNTGEVIGKVELDSDSRVCEPFLTGNPYVELYDYAWMKVKYHFFRLKINKIKPKLIIIIPTYLQSSYYSKTDRLFLLNCAPIVNLFKKQSDPIKIKPEDNEYLINTDLSNPELYQIYRIENIKIYKDNQAIELNNGYDYFLFFNNDLLVKFSPHINSGIISIDMLCSNKIKSFNNNILVLEDFNYLKGAIIKYDQPASVESIVPCMDMWKMFTLYQSNRFEEMKKSNELLQLTKDMMFLLNQSNHFISVRYSPEVGIIRKNNWIGSHHLDLITIQINYHITSSAISAIVWAKVFINLSPLNTLTKVRIVDTDGQLIKEIYETY